MLGEANDSPIFGTNLNDDFPEQASWIPHCPSDPVFHPLQKSLLQRQQRRVIVPAGVTPQKNFLADGCCFSSGPLRCRQDPSGFSRDGRIKKFFSE